MKNMIFPSIKKMIYRVKIYGPLIIFGISLLSLASLLAWWSIFIHNSIKQQRLNSYQKLYSELRYISLKLGIDKSRQPEIGILSEDERFEVIECNKPKGKFSRRLIPSWPQFCLRVRPAILKEIEKKSSRLNFMLHGEASLLTLVIFGCLAFLFWYIQLEKRTAREVKEFWENSAHEIKTPITGVKAFLQNLKSNALDKNELAPYLDLALKQIHKQEQLAENILSGYHLQSKESKLILTKVNLIEFLEEYFRMNFIHFSGAKINLKFNKREKIEVKANIHGLKVILDNIIDNALKFCSPGLILSVNVAKGKKMAIVTIEDNGPGFHPHLTENLFRAYRHLDNELPTKKQGAGLGLYISRKLSRKMRGELKAASKGKGHGSQFQIYLRLTKNNEI